MHHIKSQTVLTIGLLLLTACDTTLVTETNIGAQTPGYHIECESTPPFATYKDCDRRAAEICGRAGYTVVNKDDSLVGSSASYFSVSTRRILVKCGEPVAYVPYTYAVSP